jgi:hypothetical protein
MKYAKYHGLGNDYLVIRPDDFGGELEPKQVQLIVTAITELDQMEFFSGHSVVIVVIFVLESSTPMVVRRKRAAMVFASFRAFSMTRV